MSIINYLFIGVVFMVIVEYLLNRSDIQKHINTKIPNLGFWEIIIGVSLWPLLLGIFLYNFFKAYFK